MLTAEGTFASGLLVSETAEEITLKDADGIERTFATADLLDRSVQDVSLMPADLQKAFSEEDFVDLVEFLTTLKKE